jgi:hypothetical protein
VSEELKGNTGQSRGNKQKVCLRRRTKSLSQNVGEVAVKHDFGIRQRQTSSRTGNKSKRRSRSS